MSVEQRWQQYRWRLIRGRPEMPAMNHAIDEALTRRVGAGLRAPTLRFWDRLEPEVVIGRFQS
ncbi:MAG: lipoate--protein ligase family protein, partial [Thermomicrobiaceae bacterium]|nr:lipoate--protein ligase family protein [Thermomicrobiaceae bacterium]